MSAPILKITKDPVTLTIKKAKVVTGQFGNQLWCAAQDAQGDEHTLYLPWANKAWEMSGVAQQFIKTGHMGPEDFDPNEARGPSTCTTRRSRSIACSRTGTSTST